MRTGLSSVSWFIKKHHYSHSHPGGVDYCFAIVSKMNVLGACVFGYMAGNPKAMCVCKGIEDHHQYRELMRLVLLDELPKNSESRFVSWCLRWLKTNTNLKAIISFADPKYNHRGTIYQASNWIYTGIQKEDRPRIILQKEDLFGTFEKEIHPRQAINIFGSSAISKVGKCRTERREPKHRYVYLLRKGLELRYSSKEYPHALIDDGLLNDDRREPPATP
jgi:hypothetical protein